MSKCRFNIREFSLWLFLIATYVNTMIIMKILLGTLK